MNMPRRLLLRWLLGGTCCLSGCAQWAPDEEVARKGTSGLPPARIADEASVVDVIFWPLPRPGSTPLSQTGSDDPIASLWSEVDELSVPREVRQKLLHNGLRAGKLRHIEQVLDRFGLPDPTDEATRLLSQVSVTSDIAHSRHTIPFREGEIQDVAIRQTQSGTAAVMVRLGEETVGKRLSQPQFLCRLQVRPTVDGRLRLRLWPKVEHGEIRQSYVSSDQALRIDSARDAWQLSELATEVLLDAQETLILTATPQPIGLGKQMLTGELPDGTHERVAILVRVSRLPLPPL